MVVAAVREWLLQWASTSFLVEGRSMEPAYRPGATVRVCQLPLWLLQPERFDVVVLRSPDEPIRRLELKRLIGLPGERIRWTANRFEVNQTLLDEPYARIPPTVPGDDEAREVILKPGEFFVAGDHRLYSRDSRQYGPVPRHAILGKVHLVARVAA